jgi:flagellar assembly protein FliH
VLRRTDPSATEPSPEAGRAVREIALGRRLTALELSAEERARAIVSHAERRAERVLRAAHAEAAAVSERAAEHGQAAAAGAFAAAWTELRRQESHFDQRALDRIVGHARLLAERLVGRELEVHPAAIAELAAGVLAEAGGATRFVFRAHPEDARTLAGALRDLGDMAPAPRVVEDPALSRGDLRLETDCGAIDARLGTSLDALAARLRESIRP